MKLCMFRTVPLSIIRSLFTVHSTMVYVIETAFEQDQDGNEVPLWSCSKSVYKPVCHIPLPSVQWINSWWWIDELSEICRVSQKNRFVKLVHLVGFVTKKKYFYVILPLSSTNWVMSFSSLYCVLINYFCHVVADPWGLYKDILNRSKNCWF